MTTMTSIHNGIHTISSPRGGHRTFRIRTQPADSRFAPGERVVSLLVGPDNGSDYQGFGFVKDDGRIVVWRSKRGNGARSTYDWFADMLARRSVYEEKGYEYFVEARCRRCNRRLTTPESISRGIGPECAGRM